MLISKLNVNHISHCGGNVSTPLLCPEDFECRYLNANHRLTTIISWFSLPPGLHTVAGKERTWQSLPFDARSRNRLIWLPSCG